MCGSGTGELFRGRSLQGVKIACPVFCVDLSWNIQSKCLALKSSKLCTLRVEMGEDINVNVATPEDTLEAFRDPLL
jgi:hypothetical protein